MGDELCIAYMAQMELQEEKLLFQLFCTRFSFLSVSGNELIKFFKTILPKHHRLMHHAVKVLMHIAEKLPQS